MYYFRLKNELYNQPNTRYLKKNTNKLLFAGLTELLHFIWITCKTKINAIGFVYRSILDRFTQLVGFI